MSQTSLKPRNPQVIKYEPQYSQTKIRPDSAKMMIPGLPTGEIGDLQNFTILNENTYLAQKGSNSHRTLSRPQSSLGRPVNHSFQPQKRDLEINYDQPQNQTYIALNSPTNNSNRMIPRHINKDKENLYIEIQGLKMSLNEQSSENQKLKSSNQQLQREVDKLQVLIQSVEQFINVKSNQYSVNKTDSIFSKLIIKENILTASMKKQLKDQKILLKTKEDEIQRMKKDIKYTKVEEQQIEIKESQVEAMRLHTLLDRAMRDQAISRMTQDYNQIEEKFHIQMGMINTLKQETDYLNGLLRFQEEETFKADNLLQDVQKILRKQEGQIDDSKKNSHLKSLDIELVNDKFNSIQMVNQALQEKSRRFELNEQKIVKLEAQQIELLKGLSDRDLNIEYLDKTINELKQKIQDKSHYEAKEKRNLQEELIKTQSRFEDLDDRYKNLLLVQAQSKTKDTFHSIKDPRGQPTIQLAYKQRLAAQKIKDTSSNSMFMKQLEYAPKKLRVVKTIDVQAIGAELNLRFQLRHISIVDVIDQYLFGTENKSSGQVTIREIHQSLKGEPFLLVNQDKAMLVARYLVEDNQLEFIDFDADMFETLQIVQSIFTKLIGFYKIQTFEDEAKMKEEIVSMIEKYKSSLKSHFDTLPSVQGHLTKTQILDTFIYMDIDLRQDVLDYFFMKLFALSNKVDRFSQQKIFEVFQLEPLKEDKPSSNVKKKKKETKPTQLGWINSGGI